MPSLLEISLLIFLSCSISFSRFSLAIFSSLSCFSRFVMYVLDVFPEGAMLETPSSDFLDIIDDLCVTYENTDCLSDAITEFVAFDLNFIKCRFLRTLLSGAREWTSSFASSHILTPSFGLL